MYMQHSSMHYVHYNLANTFKYLLIALRVPYYSIAELPHRHRHKLVVRKA